MIDAPAIRAQLQRQIAHWNQAVAGLEDLTRLASRTGWLALERYLGTALRALLHQGIDRLKRQVAVLPAQLAAAETPAELRRLDADVVAFRGRYIATEAVLDFYGDAINTRTNEKLGAYLRACDFLAGRSMAPMFPRATRPPPVLTFIDKGIGASILKAGMRLWDGRSISPVSAIKIARHNLLRPTALIHEAAHELAHDLDWNRELAALFEHKLGRRDAALGVTWASWASEIGADACGFAHTGFAAVAALADVLSGGTAAALQFVPGDPHPVSYVRVLLGTAMCAHFYGTGPWNQLQAVWIGLHPLDSIDEATADLIRGSVALLPEAVELIFHTPFKAFGQRSLAEVVDPKRVDPEALGELAQRAGPALFTSDHWIASECLRLLALCGLRVATTPERAPEVLQQQEDWMQRLGQLAAA